MKSKRKDSLSAVQVITYIVLFGVGGLLIGFDYPLVPRDNVIQGQSSTLQWWSIFLMAIGAAVIMRFKRSWFKLRGDKIIGTFLYFAYFIGGFLLTSQTLKFVNGAFDKSTVQTHEATILDKYIHPRRSSSYHLVVRDWERPDRLLDFDIEKETYESLNSPSGRAVGEPIKIKTSRGFLGFERFRGVEY